jgi:hypothetical protein
MPGIAGPVALVLFRRSDNWMIIMVRHSACM